MDQKEIRVYPEEKDPVHRIEEEDKTTHGRDHEELIDRADNIGGNVDITVTPCDGVAEVRRVKIDGNRVHYSSIVKKMCNLPAAGKAKAKLNSLDSGKVKIEFEKLSDEEDIDMRHEDIEQKLSNKTDEKLNKGENHNCQNNV